MKGHELKPLPLDEFDKTKSEDNEDTTMFGTGSRHWASYHDENYRQIFNLEIL